MPNVMQNDRGRTLALKTCLAIRNSVGATAFNRMFNLSELKKSSGCNDYADVRDSGETKPKLCGSYNPQVALRKEITAGEVYATGDDKEITTTLGSCAAACLFDPIAKVGGMNHFMLPVHGTDTSVCGRYGVHAMELLITIVPIVAGTIGTIVRQ